MEEEIDISILKKIPELNTNIELEIEPLAPLSMVSELPGSYYKTLKMPDKKMLCGLFENLLGWHIDLADRKSIIKELKTLRNKQKKKNADVEFIDKSKGSTYSPLLMDYFEINDIQPVFSKVLFYDDLWKKSYRRSDSADIHMGGSSNLSFEIVEKIHELTNRISDLSYRIKDEKNKAVQKELEQEKEDAKKEKEAFFKQNIGMFPLFYSTPTKREFIDMKGKYKVALSMDNELSILLQENSVKNNLCYLGNNEGWVDLKITKI